MEKLEIQQGDLCLVRVSNIPKSAKRKIGFDGVVLKGEGVNTHTVNPSEVDVYEDNGTLYFKVDKEINLKHQEHGTQIIKPGTFKRLIEREFSYEDEEARQTRD